MFSAEVKRLQIVLMHVRQVSGSGFGFRRVTGAHPDQFAVQFRRRGKVEVGLTDARQMSNLIDFVEGGEGGSPVPGIKKFNGLRMRVHIACSLQCPFEHRGLQMKEGRRH